MEETRDVLRDAFYRVLNQDASFAANLAELHRRFPGLRWLSQVDALPADADAALGTFVIDRRWLPRGARYDMLASLDLATEQKAAPELRAHRTNIEVAGAPPAREPIAYDPIAESAQDFIARARRHVADVDSDWKAAGRKPIHPKHKSGTILRREALRLYRRRVLMWTDERAADQECTETGEYVDPETVRTSVRRWSRILGIVGHGEQSLRARMRQSGHKGPMPMACQFCRTRNLAPDAWCITYSIGQDPDPVVAICERCAERIAKVVTS